MRDEFQSAKRHFNHGLVSLAFSFSSCMECPIHLVDIVTTSLAAKRSGPARPRRRTRSRRSPEDSGRSRSPVRRRAGLRPPPAPRYPRRAHRSRREAQAPGDRGWCRRLRGPRPGPIRRSWASPTNPVPCPAPVRCPTPVPCPKVFSSIGPGQPEPASHAISSRGRAYWLRDRPVTPVLTPRRTPQARS